MRGCCYLNGVALGIGGFPVENEVRDVAEWLRVGPEIHHHKVVVAEGRRPPRVQVPVHEVVRAVLARVRLLRKRTRVARQTEEP
eukprot:854835-Rhodomonas_salina.1